MERKCKNMLLPFSLKECKIFKNKSVSTDLQGKFSDNTFSQWMSRFFTKLFINQRYRKLSQCLKKESQGLLKRVVLPHFCSVELNICSIDFENVQYWSLGCVTMSCVGGLLFLLFPHKKSIFFVSTVYKNIDKTLFSCHWMVWLLFRSTFWGVRLFTDWNRSSLLKKLIQNLSDENVLEQGLR